MDWWVWVGAFALLAWFALKIWDDNHADERAERARQLAAETLDELHRKAASTAELRRMYIGGYSYGWWGRMLRDHAYRCYYCKRQLPKHERFHKEHDIPLVRSGRHHVDNIRPSCATCNLRKGRMTGAEFLAAIEANGGTVPNSRRELRKRRAAGPRSTARAEVLAGIGALEHRGDSDGWSVSEIIAQVRVNGSVRPVASLRVTISTMGSEGALVRMSRGRYRLP